MTHKEALRERLKEPEFRKEWEKLKDEDEDVHGRREGKLSDYYGYKTSVVIVDSAKEQGN